MKLNLNNVNCEFDSLDPAVCLKSEFSEKLHWYHQRFSSQHDYFKNAVYVLLALTKLIYQKH